MIPFRLYLSLGLLVIGAALAAYVSHLRESLSEARMEAASATAWATRIDTQREADNAAMASLLEAASQITTSTKEVIREIPVLIPADACALPAGWRVLHNAAAAGPRAAPAGAPDGPASAPAPAAGDRRGEPAGGR